MQSKRLVLLGLLILVMALSVACGSAGAAAPASPTVAATATTPPAASAERATATPPAAPTVDEADAEPVAYEPQSVSGGSVVVEVMPLILKAGSPSEFEISMNTHSVDLSDDMLKAVVLKDDTGKEYAPTKWEGPEGGGHHRSGKIEFPALASDARSVTMIVKGIAKVPERTYKWEIRS